MSEQRGDCILYVSPLLLHEVRGQRKRLKKIENLKDVGDYKHTQIAHLSVKDWIFHTCEYRIAGKFCGRKPLRISQFCGYSQKFLYEIWSCGVLWHSKSEQSTKFFSVKIVFFTKFSPSNVSHYICTRCPAACL